MTSPKKTEFKVGDKVRIKKGDTSDSRYNDGKIAIITEIEDRKLEGRLTDSGLEATGLKTNLDRSIGIWDYECELYKPRVVDSPVQKTEAKESSIWGDW